MRARLIAQYMTDTGSPTTAPSTDSSVGPTATTSVGPSRFHDPQPAELDAWSSRFHRLLSRK
jgi:hypothetical protein